MTIEDVIKRLIQLPRNSPAEAVALYRLARETGVAFAGLANSLLRLQDDWSALLPQLAAVDAECGFT